MDVFQLLKSFRSDLFQFFVGSNKESVAIKKVETNLIKNFDQLSRYKLPATVDTWLRLLWKGKGRNVFTNLTHTPVTQLSDEHYLW